MRKSKKNFIIVASIIISMLAVSFYYFGNGGKFFDLTGTNNVILLNKTVVGSDIILTVSIQNVEPIYTWQIALTYNVTELTFISADRPTTNDLFAGKTYMFLPPNNNINGWILGLGGTLIGNVNGVSGSGNIVVCHFTGLSTSKIYLLVNSDTFLLDSNVNIMTMNYETNDARTTPLNVATTTVVSTTSSSTISSTTSSTTSQTTSSYSTSSTTTYNDIYPPVVSNVVTNLTNVVKVGDYIPISCDITDYSGVAYAYIYLNHNTTFGSVVNLYKSSLNKNFANPNRWEGSAQIYDSFWEIASGSVGKLYIVISDLKGNTVNYDIQPFFTIITPLTVTIQPSRSINDMKVGDSVTFTAYASGGKSPYDYSWQLNGSYNGITTSTYTFTATAKGTYVVKAIILDSLFNIASAQLNVIVSEIIPPIDVPPEITYIQQIPSVNTIDKTQSVEIRATVHDDNNNLATVKINYRINHLSTIYSIPMLHIMNTDTYSGTIPPQGSSVTFVEYEIEASDTLGYTTHSGYNALQSYTVIPEYSIMILTIILSATIGGFILFKRRKIWNYPKRNL